MLQFTSTVLFLSLCRSSLAQLGAGGQDCSGGEPEACLTNTAIYKVSEEAECENAYDCCLCAKIICGPGCESFEASGDYSAFGVPDINVTGTLSEGASIECSGFLACSEAFITGEYIEEVKCTEEGSCYRTVMDLLCLESDPCPIECSGTAACEGITLQAEFASSVTCEEAASCEEAVMALSISDPEFTIECQKDTSCHNSTFVIVTAGGVMGPIKCEESGACLDATIGFINFGTDPLLVQELDCSEAGACTGLSIGVGDTVAPIVILECKCATPLCSEVTFSEGVTCLSYDYDTDGDDDDYSGDDYSGDDDDDDY
mmetsp:Transcript_27523/g.43559  ORF Transcript_27523/g.43559 Transcript_27523/m.43559 type:complete len:316 (+) Transcript_27523:136-1083(+)